MLSANSAQALARSRVSAHEQRLILFFALFAVVDLPLIGARSLALWGVVALGTIVATMAGWKLGQRFPTSNRARVIGSIAILPPLVAGGVIAWAQRQDLKVLGLLFLAFMVIVCGWNSFIMASKFCHLSKADLDILENDFAKLGHPFW